MDNHSILGEKDKTAAASKISTARTAGKTCFKEIRLRNDILGPFIKNAI